MRQRTAAKTRRVNPREFQYTNFAPVFARLPPSTRSPVAALLAPGLVVSWESYCFLEGKDRAYKRWISLSVTAYLLCRTEDRLLPSREGYFCKRFNYPEIFYQQPSQKRSHIYTWRKVGWKVVKNDISNIDEDVLTMKFHISRQDEYIFIDTCLPFLRSFETATISWTFCSYNKLIETNHRYSLTKVWEATFIPRVKGLTSSLRNLSILYVFNPKIQLYFCRARLATYSFKYKYGMQIII